MTSNYKSLPSLAAYIDRVGAEESNFRRFLIKEQKGKYYTERCTIRILDDGSIYVNNIEHAPSEEEAKAIKEEIVKSQKEHPDRWPRSCRDAINLTKLKIPKDDNLFVFWDRERKHIIMCQQRIDLKDGGKYYKPWTFFSDGVWRDMEPDGQLPFWKPPVCRNKCKIMIHEGAKAAAAMDSLVNDLARKKELKAHPWGEELSDYEHWGMIGGAQVPHRADYKEVHAECPLMEVVYVCDRDYDGESALQKVSEYYGRSMKGIKFSMEFSNSKPGWDMADPLPASLFEGKRWIGGALRSYMCPATYATEAIPAKGKKGRPPLVLKDAFAQEWVHSITPDVYIHRDWPDVILTADEFDDKVYPYSDSHTTSVLMKKNDAIKSVEIKYVPGKESGFFVDNSRYFNTHCPSSVREEKGDPRPFTDFMEYLFPVEFDRIEVMRWIATLIARPDIKMLYALLLISEKQGVGKGTLAERILEPIIGKLNVKAVDENEVVDSQYTYWMAHKRLVIIHEIYAGHNSKAYNKLKSVITDKTVQIKKKYLSPYDLDNWLHIVACSNNFNALKLTMEDRRWLIPKVTEEKRPASYWTGFNNWLTNEGGLGIIVYWAREFLEKNEPVAPGQDAPRTANKMMVVEESYSDGQTLVANILRTIKQLVEGEDLEWKRCMLLDVDLVGLIKDNIYDMRQNDRLERPRTIRSVAKDCGWFSSQERVMLRDGTIGRLICLEENDATRPHAQVFQEVLPTRIRKLGKKLLCIEDGVLFVRDGEEKRAFSRKELEDGYRAPDKSPDPNRPKVVPFLGGKKD